MFITSPASDTRGLPEPETTSHGGFPVMRAPTTHISSLASLDHLCIQMVNPGLLIDALDRSTDLRTDLGDTMADNFSDLLEKKNSRCSEWFHTNLATLGIQEPLVVIIYPNGEWCIDEGHHRLAWALLNKVAEVPVVFDDTGAGDDSNMGFVVSRADVDAYHFTTNEDLVVEAETLLVDEVVTFLEDKTVRIPVALDLPPVGRHGKGRHRA